MIEKTKAPRKPRAPKTHRVAEVLGAVVNRDARKPPKRITALQRARLKLTAATVPQYAVRGPLAARLLSSPSPFALALATATFRDARKLLRDASKYSLHPFRNRSFRLA